MVDVLTSGLLAYLLGSISGSLLLGRLRGVDIREFGSGNAGATNALRARGVRFATGVFVVDVGKGMLAVWALPRFGPWYGDLTLDLLTLAALCGFFAIVGHIWPLYYRFRGGKGVATALGAVAVLAPVCLPVLLAMWGLTLVLTGYAGLASIVAGFSLLPALWVLEPRPLPAALIVFAVVTAFLLLYAHRDNVRRILAGSEYCFDRARIFHRR